MMSMLGIRKVQFTLLYISTDSLLLKLEVNELVDEFDTLERGQEDGHKRMEIMSSRLDKLEHWLSQWETIIHPSSAI